MRLLRSALWPPTPAAAHRASPHALTALLVPARVRRVSGWPGPVTTDVRRERHLVLTGTVVRCTDDDHVRRSRAAAS